MRAKRSIYATIYIKGSHRAKFTPRVSRPWRPRVIAWAGPTAFYSNRFYEPNKWYKARITKPELIPRMHTIDPDKYLSPLERRMQETSVNDVNIGFKAVNDTPSQPVLSEDEMENLSWKRKLRIDLKLLSHSQRSVLQHYRIFEDLFGEGVYFDNVQRFSVNFGGNFAYQGNILKAHYSKDKPNIWIESVGRGYNSLLIVSLDGNLYENSSELIHWFISNIEDGQSVDKCDEVIPYLQALPFKGTGYHRFAAVLFHHDEKVDFSSYQSKRGDLLERSFKMQKFYKENEDQITPSSICFVQTEWDLSVHKALHALGLKSSLFKYLYNPPLLMDQKEFPNKPQPFDLYLDQFRDPLETEAKLLKKRLEMTTEDGPPKQPRYPDINYAENKKTLPAWLHSRRIRENCGSGRFYSLWNNPIDS